MFFFFNDTATTEIYTLSLHDALPIFPGSDMHVATDTVRLAAHDERRLGVRLELDQAVHHPDAHLLDRKSTRLNSSHSQISYAVFCLKKKKPRCLVAGSACFLPSANRS